MFCSTCNGQRIIINQEWDRLFDRLYSTRPCDEFIRREIKQRGVKEYVLCPDCGEDLMLCPVCERSVEVSRENNEDVSEYNGREIVANEYEVIEFRCGTIIVNKKIDTSCT